MRTQKRMCGITKTRIGEICEETNRGHYTNIRVVIHGCRYWKDLSSRLHAMVLSQLVVNKRSLAYSHLQARSARRMNGEEALLFRLYTFQHHQAHLLVIHLNRDHTAIVDGVVAEAGLPLRALGVQPSRREQAPVELFSEPERGRPE